MRVRPGVDYKGSQLGVGFYGLRQSGRWERSFARTLFFLVTSARTELEYIMYLLVNLGPAFLAFLPPYIYEELALDDPGEAVKY